MFRYINVQWWCSSEHTSSTRPWQSDGPSLGVIPMFPSLYVLRSLCSPVRCSQVSMFPSLYVPRFYVPRSLCSPVLCSPVPMFPNPYVPQYLCSPIPMFPGTYLPRVFFWGGGGRGRYEECWNNLLTKFDKRLATFFKMFATATLEDLFCSFFDRKRWVISIFQWHLAWNVISDTKFFIPRPTKLGRCRPMSVRPSCCSAVCLSVRVSILEQICGRISLILHTHTP